MKVKCEIFQFKQVERRSLKKKSGLQRDSNPWPPRYRCDALPTELWSHTLGAKSIYWVHIFPCSEIMWSIYEIIHICRWKWSVIIAINFPIYKQLERRSLKKKKKSGLQPGSNPVEALIFFRLFNILVPRGRAPFGQHQESRPLAKSNTGSPRFTDFPSLCACSESSLTNLIGSGLNLLSLQSHSKTECRWTRPEVAILGAEQKERGLWGREWLLKNFQIFNIGKGHNYLGVEPSKFAIFVIVSLLFSWYT